MNTLQIIAMLRERGYKVTPQRLAVCKLMLSSKDHPTAEQIYQKVKEENPTISPATVYQTLHLLTNVGLVQELGLSDRVSRYDPNTSPHINVVCEKCGEITDYEAESIKEMWSKIVEELGFKPTGQRLEIFRYCDKCRKSAGM
jgi:Fur family peroxide stress response transcriptional regulator